MATEQISPRFVELDSWSTRDIIDAMYEGQLAAAAAVRAALPDISDAADHAVPALQRGGRLVYVGAGTSGRIAVQDGAELPPTYNWPLDRLVFIMAGGTSALLKSSEGAEDRSEDGSRAIADADDLPQRRCDRRGGERDDTLHRLRPANCRKPGRRDNRHCEQRGHACFSMLSSIPS